MKFVVGIDVGGKKKGFHGAIMKLSEDRIDQLFHETEPEKVVGIINEMKGECAAIAIDCPPKASIEGEETREAERELHKMGYRVQWTPRNKRKVQEWMVNGENLWDILKEAMHNTKIIETFPTAASDGLHKIKCCLPLQLLCGKDKRKFYKDYIDACICAIVAELAVHDKVTMIGLKDELGPICIL